MRVSHVAYVVSFGSRAHVMLQFDVCACRWDIPSWFRRAPTDGASPSHVCRGTRHQHHVACIDVDVHCRTWVVLGHGARVQRLVSRNAHVVRARARRNVPWTSKRTSGCVSLLPSLRMHRLRSHAPTPWDVKNARHRRQMDNGKHGKRRDRYSAVQAWKSGAWICSTKGDTRMRALKRKQALTQAAIFASHELGHDVEGARKVPIRGGEFNG